MKKKKVIAAQIISVILFLAVVCGTGYVNSFYHALPREETQQSVRLQKSWIVTGEDTRRGLIFYPGGKVEEEAYIPLMEEVAAEGFTCILVRMPVRLAVLDAGAAERVMEAFPDITEWYLGGHSLGGAMAADYAAGHGEQIQGLVLLGAYAAKPLPADMKVLSVYGSKDNVLNREKYASCRSNLPKDTREYVIEGGNHAGFGWYGAQEGDGEARITPQEQWKITAEQIEEWADAK